MQIAVLPGKGSNLVGERILVGLRPAMPPGAFAGGAPNLGERLEQPVPTQRFAALLDEGGEPRLRLAVIAIGRPTVVNGAQRGALGRSDADIIDLRPARSAAIRFSEAMSGL